MSDSSRSQRAFGPSRSGPLSGVLIADFSRVLAGPYATMLLADFGATVIKVEGPAGDDTRRWRPPVHGEDSTYYLAINRGKYDIVLDFSDPDDQTVAQQLAARADVIVENFKPGGLERFGLDYATVAETNPDVIYTSVTGFGPQHPMPGYDLLIQGLSGFMSLTGEAQGPAYRGGVAVFDVITGLHTAIGILAALRDRDFTGTGQQVQTNLLSSALSGLVNQASAYAAGSTVPTRMGNAHPSVYPYQPFPTGDGDLIIACGNDNQFAALARAVGRPDWLVDDRYAAAADRNAHRDELHPEIVEALRAHSAQEWYEILSRAGLPCAPINTVAEGMALADQLGLDPIVPTGSGERVIPTVRNPITLTGSHTSYDLAPPELGADSESIRAWLAAVPTR